MTTLNDQKLFIQLATSVAGGDDKVLLDKVLDRIVKGGGHKGDFETLQKLAGLAKVLESQEKKVPAALWQCIVEPMSVTEEPEEPVVDAVEQPVVDSLPMASMVEPTSKAAIVTPMSKYSE